MAAAAEHVREKVGAIRHPETGEFPTIVVSGTSLEDIELWVEGSPERLSNTRRRQAIRCRQRHGPKHSLREGHFCAQGCETKCGKDRL